MPARSRRTPKKPEQWEAWLAAFEREGTVTAACEATRIARRTVYDHRERDEAFAEGWADIEERTTERMEQEAYRRGVQGVEKPVYYKGDRVDTIREYSDTLLIFMLKSRRPEKYREHHRVEHTGPGGAPLAVEVNLDEDARKALADVLRRRPASRS